jgi:biotin carboxyl carrier protein
MKSEVEVFEFKKGCKVKVYAQIVGQQLWLHYEGQIFCRDLQTKSKSRKQAQGQGADEVLAPMPGKVTKILVSPNSKVRVGDALLMMEAMKMEYTLKAEIAGTIEVIDAVEGSQVTLGKRLVKISPEKPKA